jgi:hypothetical protein
MLDLEQLQRDIRNHYKNQEAMELDARIENLIGYLKAEYGLDRNELTLPEIRLIVNTILAEQTASFQEELEALLVQKERVERQIERKSERIQEEKHHIFNALEALLDNADTETQAKLHQVKLQSIDLFDMLEEVVETAIITTLERNHDIEETIEEICKEITYETLGEGPLETGRIRLVIGSILHSAVDVSEATPNQAEAIMLGTLKGVRSGLIKAIRRLKKQLLYMPEELKVTASMQTELLRTDVLFTRVLQDEALQCSPESRALLEKLSKEIRYDLEELVEVSRETVDLMKGQLSQAISRSQVLNSRTASEAKRVGVSAWRSAKTALEGALQNAKGKIDKK